MSSLRPPNSPFHSPSLPYTLLTQPMKTFVRLLEYALALLGSIPEPDSPPIRIVCISDTHCLTSVHIPDGDLLIHAGDLTNAGTPAELQAQIDWLDSLPHQHKVAVAGNHDTFLDPRSRITLSPEQQEGSIDWKGIHYLQHSALTLRFANGRRSLNLYGAPQIPACGGDEFAFQYPRGHDAWTDTIPGDTDLLITHTPPKYHLDLPTALGCEFLLSEVWRVRPALHVFGHVHAGKSDTLGWLKGGKEVVRWDEGQKCLERTLARPDGLVRELLNPRNWLDVMMVLGYGVMNVVWDRVWGGGQNGATLMVNASLMFNNTGELRNRPQVIHI
ncbi:hypothetical protein B0A54_10493 [Friedmanniomyces endolithicus]|uniref:Calcineurin-like phosphoesterase domain-containing protein n=1 Tax=Friedmanniomyces endolithicus TaxID=329885 RepID=A0A4U0UPN7_9PEZI|nr:hypothetical protein LTS09_003399 [Friedmanniomyces endolithicus]TKA37891.1 hypothetical protein B0A54_10493 [Friedmanniomyces endolithicus]